MKKIILGLMVLVLFSFGVFAQGGQGTSESGTGISTSDTNGGQNTGQGLVDNIDNGDINIDKGGGNARQVDGALIRNRVLAKNTIELKEMLREKEMTLNQGLAQLKVRERKIMENQNQVRLAVHSLLAMENLTNGIGPRVSEIAMEFDNSLQENLEDETLIQKRSSFAKVFVGGNTKVAERLENRTLQLKERVEELKTLEATCDCEEGVKEVLQEQIQKMEQENQRLQNMAEEEKKVKGLFGWLFRK